MTSLLDQCPVSDAQPVHRRHHRRRCNNNHTSSSQDTLESARIEFPHRPRMGHKSALVVGLWCLLGLTLAHDPEMYSQLRRLHHLHHRKAKNAEGGGGHHRSHPYYARVSNHFETLRSSPPSGPVSSPFYLLQQIVRQQQRSFGRHSHSYYSTGLAAGSHNSSELNPVRRDTFRRVWSARQKGARLLLLEANSTQPHAAVRIVYQSNGIKSDDQLPVCGANQVCNKVDTYSSPWIEKQCRCATATSCSESLQVDENTIREKTRQYKVTHCPKHLTLTKHLQLCEPVKDLPTCRYFRDITWTITTTSVKSESNLNSLLTIGHFHPHHQHQAVTGAENITRQEVKCVCPPDSVPYISKHQVYQSPDGQLGYRYHFACSPETKLRCKRKEPCGLFTAKKRARVEEVTSNTLCQCPTGTTCPSNHHHPSVLIGTVYPLDNIRTYSAYCY